MTSVFANPLGSEANRSPQNRLNSLKVRTMLTAMAALLCGFFGARLITAPLAKVGAWVYGLFLQQGSLPLVHVPLGTSTELAYWLPQATFLLISALAIIGFSAGVFGRTSARVVMIPPLLVGLATAFVMPATSQWMHLLPSQLERDIMHGRYDAAETVLKQAGVHSAVKQYVQAQIALRANDEQALQTYGEPVLKLADQWAYGLPAAGDHGAVSAAVQFNPEVIYALDLALNREPQTQVGIQWQKDYASHGTFWVWLVTIGMLCLGLALLAASLGLLVLWNSMRRRVRGIQAEIVPVRSPERMPIADSATAPAITPVTTGDAKLRPSTWNRRARYAVVGTVVLGAAYFGLKAQVGSSAQPAPAGVGTHPCAYVGVWTAARDQSVYKVTLKDTGDYVAEPIARGAHSGSAIRGTWMVRGDAMEWTYASNKAIPRDINQIRNASAKSFTLDEVDGTSTQYNLIEATTSSTCTR